jgi:hypothetical protein
MGKSLFQKNNPEDPAPTPYELIEPEIVHLKKGYSIRHGPQARKKRPLWLVSLAFCGLAWLYLMDPVVHAWYKGEAMRTYLYLHNYGSAAMCDKLMVSQILTPDDAVVLNRRTGSFQDYYPSPDAANHQAEDIIAYMTNVKRLHNGDYEPLNPFWRLRYALFIYPGLVVPTQWDFLDPSVGE